jgi:protein-disulfide isomerase
LAESRPIVSEALEAAGEQGKFWEFHDKLVLSMPRDVPGLKKLAAQMGLDVQMFDEALDSEKYNEKVELAKEKAISRGVTHSAIFINGKEYTEYPPTCDGICAIIAKELAKIGMEGS